MARPGGNPELVVHQYTTDRDQPLTAFLGIRCTEAMKEALKAKGKNWQEFARKAIQTALDTESQAS
jgi:hypothetical protein